MALPIPILKGLSSGAVRTIPDEWDKQWFRRFIVDHLQDADYRNAIAGPGISITGTEQQPGTIGIGGVGPVTLPGPLTVTGKAGQTTLLLNEATTTDFGGIRVSNSGATRVLEILHIGSANGATYGAPANGNVINSSSAAAGLSLSTADVARLSIDNNGVVNINAPTSGDSLSISVLPGEGLKVNNAAGGAAGTFLSWRSVGVEVGFLGNGTGIGGANANDFGIGSDSGQVILHASAGVAIAGPNSGQALNITGRGATVAGVAFNTMATTGAATPTLTANKPGGATGVATWLVVLVDGNTRYIPCWS